MAEADEAQAPVAVDTTVSEPTAPSEDVELEDMDISIDEMTDSDDEESPASETESEAVEEDEAPAVETEQSEEPEQETPEEDTPSEISDEEARKRYNDEMAKRRIAEKQLRQEREQREQENLKRYLEEAGDDEFELAKRQTEVERHLLQREKAQVLQDKVQVSIDRAIAEIDLFRTGTPEIKEELAKSLDDFERMYVKRDNTGNYTSVEGDVYQYLQEKADSIRRLTGIGARLQTKQKANEQMRTVTRPTRTPKEPKVDPDLSDFDKAWE
jgi:hypothetical protein